MSKQSGIKEYYTAKGLTRYKIEIRHDELNKYQIIKGDNHYVVEQKAISKRAQWDKMWENRLNKQRKVYNIRENKNIAVERTKQAIQELKELMNILAHSLTIDNAIDWVTLKKDSDYTEPKPLKPMLPKKPSPQSIYREPKKNEFMYLPKLNALDRIFKSRQQRKEFEKNRIFELDHKQWMKKREELCKRYKEKLIKWENEIRGLARQYKKDLTEWEMKRREYIKNINICNASIDQAKEEYLNRDPEKLLEYCDMVLSNSKYPDYFPQFFDLDYNPTNKILIIDYQLPALNNIHTLNEVKYVQTRDQFDEKHISNVQLNKLYDNILYQITIRSVHEIFEADKIDAISSIIFNGFVRSIDPATGKETNACILSLQANKVEFLYIKLANVEPKACFKKLKGVGCSQLHSITPIAPIIKMNKEDKRFIDSYAVAENIENGENIAAMDWGDFEHLVREVFEKEFTQNGGEVKVTQASRDGGVDAIAFDPDPIRGGKIVIQAKRYTNVVGVAAVRDLYGTVMNEGAIKGILITTSDYGPDAYEFANNKPLTLLNGSNLLHLLERHGHKAKIDLKEAKKLLLDRK